MAWHGRSCICCHVLYAYIYTHSNSLWTTHFWRYLSAKSEGCLYSFAYYIYSFVRYVAMHRSTFWRFRKVERVNMYHPLDQREKQLIRILRKPLKMVSMLKTLFFLSLEFLVVEFEILLCSSVYSCSSSCIPSYWAISIFICYAWACIVCL